jgi:predicted helicase
MNNPFNDYISSLQKTFATGDAREHAYRPAFQRLIEQLRPDISVINEPAYKGGNAPDFLFKKGDVPISYAECKDIDIALDNKEVKKQANRYVGAFGKILLTNYLEFEILDENNDVIKFKIAELVDGHIKAITENFQLAENLIKDYITPSHQTIKSAKKLAKIMASKARLLRDNTLASLEENPESDIMQQYETFKQVLIHGLTKEQFSDMYAQTLVYGLFVARYFDPTLPTFSRHEAHDLLPSTNPLLKKFFGHVAGVNYDQKIAWMIEGLIQAYLVTDVHELMHKEFKRKQKDPVLHFYETFLSEYDPKLRKNRGVYYTPEPVVSFIVRSVDEILKTKFSLPKGLADTSKIEIEEEAQGEDARRTDGKKRIKKKINKVQILDPAVGTGTFLNEVIHEIYKNFQGQEGLWPNYVKNELLPRLHGFELMMASYTMAHLKLGITLAELGYKGDTRLSVWLTNSLDAGTHEVPNLFMAKWLTEESNEASKIKKNTPVMTVIGNPPYSGESYNKDFDGHDVYKVEPEGKQKLQERNSKWINDDYVKFIRLAEMQINKTGEGVFGLITPHGFLDNPTFRGMRWHLMQSFDEIYILDLHGNSNKKDQTPSGGKDENVFSIKTGTAITFAIKKPSQSKKTATLYHAELWGKQKEKYDKLTESSWKKLKWKEIKPQGKNLFFIPFNYELKEKYELGFSINQLFTISTVGIVTSRDAFIIDRSPSKLENRIQDFLSIPPDTAQQKYKLRENRKWKIQLAQKHTYDKKNIKKISYRPFDNQHVYYNNDFIERSRNDVMQNYLNTGNLGLLLTKCVRDSLYNHVFSTKNISEAIFLSGTTATNAINLPLYLYTKNLDGSTHKIPNFDASTITTIENHLGLYLTQDFTPEDILDYIYAVLHSPRYREKYKEFLKIDFPHIPYPKDKDTFWKLVELGREIRLYHLMEHDQSNDLITTYPEAGNNTVTKKLTKASIGFEITDKERSTGKVWINDEQYFGNVPELAWNFYIGGYQPAQKWLKDRHERELSNEDILHYQKIIVALTNTDRLMKEIDKVITF